MKCMRFSGCLKSPQNSEYANYSDATPTECDPNYRNAAHKQLIVRMSYNVFCTCKSDARILRVVRSQLSARVICDNETVQIVI